MLDVSDEVVESRGIILFDIEKYSLYETRDGNPPICAANLLSAQPKPPGEQTLIRKFGVP